MINHEETQPRISDRAKWTESFYRRSMELPDELLIGAIDSHVHAGPVLSSNPGHLDPIQVAQEAAAAGMRSIVYYDVFGWASGTAWMVNRHVSGIHTYGGYLMNSCHGGMNPRSVNTALHLEEGCRFISFGSHCTRYSAERESTLIDGKLVPFKDAFPRFAEKELPYATYIPVEGSISEELDEILTMIAAHPQVYLNTGHVSVAEAFRLLDLAKEYGIKKVLIAHPVRGKMTIEEQKLAASKGAFLEGCLVDWLYPDVPRTHYYVEKEYMDMSAELGRHSNVMKWMRTIQEVGVEHFVLGTDYGIRASSTPVQAMRTMVSTLLDFGFAPDDIYRMIAINPAVMIGMDD